MGIGLQTETNVPSAISAGLSVRRLNPTGDDDGDGYTNIEEWLHEFAAEMEKADKPLTSRQRVRRR